MRVKRVLVIVLVIMISYMCEDVSYDIYMRIEKFYLYGKLSDFLYKVVESLVFDRI